MFAWIARPRPFDPKAQASDAVRLEIERLRAFVEMRAQAQENLMRAMLQESTARAAEALEGRIQLAIAEAVAFAGQGLERHEASMRAFGRRLADLSREPLEPEPLPDALPDADEFWLGAGAPLGRERRLPLRDDAESAYLVDLAHLPILPGGATRIVASHVVEFTPAAALAAKLLPHWRSRLAPGGELVVVTLDGPAWAADIQSGACDFAALRERLGVDGASRPLRQLFDAARLAQVLREVGFAPGPPQRSAPYTVSIVATPA